MVGAPAGNSIFASNSTTAPGALVNLAIIAAGSLPAALYHIACYAMYGTVAGPDDDFNLRIGGVTVLTMRVSGVANATTPQLIELVRQLDGATAVNFQTIAGSATGIYKTTIVATPIKS